MLTFVNRNDKIPLRVTKTLTTEADYQTSVPITVFQGERPKTKDNVKLGHFDLGGIPPAKRGVPQVEVTFEVDEDSILHVSAVDTASKNVGSITITESTTLSQDEIERMVKDSEDNAEKDKVWRDRQAKAQEAEAYMYEIKHAVDTSAVRDGLSSSVSSHTLTLQQRAPTSLLLSFHCGCYFLSSSLMISFSTIFQLSSELTDWALKQICVQQTFLIETRIQLPPFSFALCTHLSTHDHPTHSCLCPSVFVSLCSSLSSLSLGSQCDLADSV